MNRPKRLSLKKRLTQEVTLWVLFALDSECLSKGALLPLRLDQQPTNHTLPQTRLDEQFEAWRSDESIWRIGFSHIKKKDKVQQLWETDAIWESIEEELTLLLQYQSALDALISRSAIRWKLNRMGSIDRSILRFGAYMLYFNQELPVSVILSEAIELGKRYGAADSGRFINGVLDKVAQELKRIKPREHQGVQVSVVQKKR